MDKTKKSFFNLGILLFSFLLISCDDKLNLVYRPIETPEEAELEIAKAQADDSSEQQTRVEQKIAEQGYVEAQADDFVSSEQQTNVEQKAAEQENVKVQADDSVSPSEQQPKVEQETAEVQINSDELRKGSSYTRQRSSYTRQRSSETHRGLFKHRKTLKALEKLGKEGDGGTKQIRCTNRRDALLPILGRRKVEERLDELCGR